MIHGNDDTGRLQVLEPQKISPLQRLQNSLDASIGSVAYPSGHMVTDAPGGAPRLLSTDTSANISYAANAHYWPSGTLGALSKGGSISFTTVINSRLQRCWVYGTTGSALPWSTTACSGTGTTGNILDLKYNYNLGSADNGNVAGVTNNRDTTRSQTFGYDPLNRLTTVQTTSTYSSSSSNCFGESFGYGAWGNLLSVGEASSSYDSCRYEQPQGWTMNAKKQIQSFSTIFLKPRPAGAVAKHWRKPSKEISKQGWRRRRQ